MNTKEYYEELAKHPGKFEGEQPWAPYFWEQAIGKHTLTARKGANQA